MKLKKLSLTLILIGLFALPLSAAGKQWLHVQVHGDGDEKVNINIPMTLISTVLPIIEEKAMSEAGIGHHGVRWDDSDISVAEMREIWNAVKAEGSFELANIQSDEHSLSVFLDGQYLRVESTGDAKERVHVKLPMVVVDALLSGDGEKLDVMAALEALQNLSNQDLVLVEADDTRVRVWIDEMSAPGR